MLRPYFLVLNDASMILQQDKVVKLHLELFSSGNFMNGENLTWLAQDLTGAKKHLFSAPLNWANQRGHPCLLHLMDQLNKVFVHSKLFHHSIIFPVKSKLAKGITFLSLVLCIGSYPYFLTICITVNAFKEHETSWICHSDEEKVG